MFKQLDEVEAKYEEISLQLQDPSVTSDQDRYRKLMKDYSDLGEVVSVYRQYRKNSDEIESSKEILKNESDEELRSLAKEELSVLEPAKAELEKQLQFLLLPKDPNDEKNVILEMRAGAGGDEASLFAEELFRAYTHYASQRKWKVEILSRADGNVGGVKEIIATISGNKVYSRLKHESGVHRVQRVPKTETQGRIHTSTITVAVLPEAEEVDVDVNTNDLRIDVYRASGAGGQHVNTTDSAVRITHIPSGIVVSCQDEKSQHKNKAKALKVLYSRILAYEQEKAQKDASDARLAQIGTGDRSERIRTYNFPQTRITDHRIGLTIHQLNQVMSGDLDHVVAPLLAHFQAEALKAQTSQSPE
jgi:peptide chain release factor 1